MPRPYNLLIGALWVAWLVYWLVAASGAKTTVRREDGLSRLAYDLPLWIGAIIMAGRRLPGAFLHVRVFPADPWLLMTSLAVVAAGLAFAVWARVHLGANWSAAVTLKEDHELVTSGPYSLARHPIYTGILLALLGTAVAVGEARGLIALAIATAAFWIKLRREERLMLEIFGSRYEDYRAKVAALIPLLL